MSGAEGGVPIAFCCNICGRENCLPRDRFTREAPTCSGCASTVRMRAVIRCLSLALFGRSLRLDEMPANPSIRGRGLSDWNVYADALARLFAYRNTFLDTEPRLDITAPPGELLGTLDFLIASDVFEHVAPPVDRAFAGAFALLKPRGKLIFTVPYSLDQATVEHFPTLNEFELLSWGEERYLLNRRLDGTYELFDRLVFHGGGVGPALEMRIFCERDVIGQLERAAFTGITIHAEDDPAVGVINSFPWSLPITATAGGVRAAF